MPNLIDQFARYPNLLSSIVRVIVPITGIIAVVVMFTFWLYKDNEIDIGYHIKSKPHVQADPPISSSEKRSGDP